MSDRNSSRQTARDAVVALNRNRDFLKLWAGETVSDFGSYIGSVSISFAAVIALRATPFQMGLLAASRNVPALLFSLLAGVWVDRLRRRPLMIGADLGRFILLGTVPLAALFGVLSMPQLYAVILAASLLDLIFGVAYRSYLPSLVEREQLVAANSRLTASSAVAEVGGFGFAGWIVQWLTAPFAIGVDAVSFLASALAIGFIRKPEPAPEPRDAKSRVLSEIAEGARFVLGERRLRALALVSIIGGLGNSMFGTMYMLFVVNALGFKPGALGMLFAAGGLSSLGGAIAARRTSQALGAGRAMSLGLGVEAVASTLLVLARGAGAWSVAVILEQQIIGDMSGTVYAISATSLVQAITPQPMLGRVNASLRFVGVSSALAGQLFAGVLGGVIGLRATMVLGGIAMAAGALLLALSAAGRIERLDEPPQPAADATSAMGARG
ncbi:MAG TPA: MFS transporter [Candidatus Binataceae bacterium]|nr:MFS transporter [Candidatus Binataceae bacterium]